MKGKEGVKVLRECVKKLETQCDHVAMGGSRHRSPVRGMSRSQRSGTRWMNDVRVSLLGEWKARRSEAMADPEPQRICVRLSCRC